MHANVNKMNFGIPSIFQKKAMLNLKQVYSYYKGTIYTERGEKKNEDESSTTIFNVNLSISLTMICALSYVL